MVNVSTRPRSTIVRLFSAVTLLTVFCLSFIGGNSDGAQNIENARLTVGLVNEDVTAKFNSNEYTFGVSLVDRISKNTEYNWVVASRPIAEKTYKDGSLDALLYIPRSFTHDILTFQDLAPTKATIEYKIQPQPDEHADQLLESRIVAILNGFNESIIKMYYTSLADSLAEADGNMHGVLTNQEALIAALTTDVQKPFSGTLPNIKNFVSSATGLKDVNTATIKVQNTFIESVTNSLTSGSEALAGQLPAINEHAQRQQEIAHINTINSNKGITEQANSDLDFYSAQFHALRTSLLCKLTGRDTADDPVPCALPDGIIPSHLNSRITELQNTITQYKTNHTQAVDILHVDLETRIQNLKTIKTLLTNPVTPADSLDPIDPVDPDSPVDPVDPLDPPAALDPAIVASLQTEILALETTRDSLHTALPAPALDSALTNVDTWYAKMVNNIKDASLTSSTIGNLEVHDWSSYSPDRTGLYIDTSSDLHSSITGLVSQAAQTSKQIAQSTATVPDNTNQFDMLLQNAAKTLNNTENILAGVKNVAFRGNTWLEQNQAYYAGFSTVLANTRTQGVDTSSIYNFFAAPINTKNITPERVAITATSNLSGWLELKWVAVFSGGLLTGILATLLNKLLRKNKQKT